MPKTPVYIKSLDIRDIRTFRDINLNFEKRDSTLSQWTILLGDNGIGKSTLLQCVAWMKPNIPVIEPGNKVDREQIHPTITNEDNETLTKIVRKDADSSWMKAKFVANRTLNERLTSGEDFCETSITVGLINKKLDQFKPTFETNNEAVFFNEDIVIYAYSASRKVGKLNINDVNLEDTLPAFISENTVLYDAEEILHTIHYAALGAKGNKQAKYFKYLEQIKNLLVSVLPNFESVDDIQINSPELVGNRIQQTEILINTTHGKEIPFNDFSLGYKAVASLVIDLSWRLINEYPDSKIPLSQPAIVLIDEIDLHLHPNWQRDLISNLSDHFPKVQFIVTAHSPLVVQSNTSANYAVLKKDAEGVKIINEPEDVDGWQVDQILTSSFFGFTSARGAKYEKLFNERQTLLSKKRLDSGQKKRLKNLTNLLTDQNKFPSGNTPEEIEDRQAISKLVAELKLKKVPIKL